ncbi:hypothetical protein BUY89_11380, partial [Staphylococcus equorum]|uniref:hypothetical protein n=1 Tax=Staphylococcus equorum TaxID=246432 RepID=UPI000D45CE4C
NKSFVSANNSQNKTTTHAKVFFTILFLKYSKIKSITIKNGINVHYDNTLVKVGRNVLIY